MKWKTHLECVGSPIKTQYLNFIQNIDVNACEAIGQKMKIFDFFELYQYTIGNFKIDFQYASYMPLITITLKVNNMEYKAELENNDSITLKKSEILKGYLQFAYCEFQQYKLTPQELKFWYKFFNELYNLLKHSQVTK